MLKNIAFETSQMHINYRRILYIGIPYTLFEILGLILSTLGFFESNIRLYVFVIVLFHLAYLSVLWINRRSLLHESKKIYYFDWIYYTVILLWSSLFTALVYVETKDITIYSIVAMLIAAMFIIRPKIAASMYTINFIFFAVLVYSKASSIGISNELTFKALIITVIAFIVSNSSYRIRQDHYSLTSQLVEANEKLQERSVRDSLTKLYNNGYIFDYLEKAIEKSQGRLIDLSVMMMDIDDFKVINDSFGHLMGDNVLRDIAEILIHETRDSDVVSRYGGEEFMVVLTRTDVKTAKKIAERIRSKIENHDFGLDKNITMSIGVKQLRSENIHELISEADKLLYQAKNSGKNRVCVE